MTELSWVSNARGGPQLLRGGPRGVCPGTGLTEGEPIGSASLLPALCPLESESMPRAIQLSCCLSSPCKSGSYLSAKGLPRGNLIRNVVFHEMYNFSFGEMKTVWGRKEYKEERITCNVMTLKKSCYVLSSSPLDRFSWQNYSNCIRYIEFCILFFSHEYFPNINICKHFLMPTK